MIKYLLGSIVMLFLVLLVYGGLTGRVRAQGGCRCPAVPDNDLRVRLDVEDSNMPQARRASARSEGTGSSGCVTSVTYRRTL